MPEGRGSGAEATGMKVACSKVREKDIAEMTLGVKHVTPDLCLERRYRHTFLMD